MYIQRKFMYGKAVPSSPSLKFPGFWLILLLFPIIGCDNRQQNVQSMNEFPPVILWAWERPEDLEFIDSNKYGVAFLAQTLHLKGDTVELSPRRQPLKVSPSTKLIAVTRIETPRSAEASPLLSDNQITRTAEQILSTISLKNVSAIQIDFDAKVSERDFYKRLIAELRSKLPHRYPLSITALASFCLGDNWIEGLPVDEAVPMIFDMGTDDKVVKQLLADGGDFKEGLCRRSYGISVDEPLDMRFQPGRRVYAFSSKPWDNKFLDKLKRRLQHLN